MPTLWCVLTVVLSTPGCCSTVLTCVCVPCCAVCVPQANQAKASLGQASAGQDAVHKRVDGVTESVESLHTRVGGVAEKVDANTRGIENAVQQTERQHALHTECVADLTRRYSPP